LGRAALRSATLRFVIVLRRIGIGPWFPFPEVSARSRAQRCSATTYTAFAPRAATAFFI
jgi:hypothetical protein